MTLVAHLRSDLGGRFVAQGQEDPRAERLDERAPGLRARQHGAERGDRLRGDGRDAATLARQREGLLVARRIVLTDGGERLVFVADEHCGPEVASWPAGGLGGAPEERLYPGVLEQHADRASERRVRARGHVEREDAPLFDQLGERRQPAAKPRNRQDGCGVLVRRIVIYMYGWGLIRFRRRRTEHARDLRLIEQRQEDGDALDDRGAELGVERDPVVEVPSSVASTCSLSFAARAALAFLGLVRVADGDVEVMISIGLEPQDPMGAASTGQNTGLVPVRLR